MTNANNEIPVRRRDRGGVPWWAWVIVVVLLALLAWYLLGSMNNNSGSGAAASPSITPEASPDLASPSGAASPAPSGSPASSWIGDHNLTVVLPTRPGS